MGALSKVIGLLDKGEPAMSHSESGTMRCERCKGTGWVDSEFQCDWCHGTGQIEVEIEQRD